MKPTLAFNIALKKGQVPINVGIQKQSSRTGDFFFLCIRMLQHGTLLNLQKLCSFQLDNDRNGGFRNAAGKKLCRSFSIVLYI